MRYNKKMMAVIIASAMAVSQMFSAAAYAVYPPQLPPMTVIPENLLNVQVTDTAGNPVNGVEVAFYNSSGEYSGNLVSGEKYYGTTRCYIDDCTRTSPDEVLSYGVPWRTFERLLDLDALESLHTMRITDDPAFTGYGIEREPRSIVFEEGQTQYFRLGIDSTQKATSMITLGANEWGIYVDPKWEDFSENLFLEMDGQYHFFNKPEDENPNLSFWSTFTYVPDDYTTNSIGIERVFNAAANQRERFSMRLNRPNISDTTTKYVNCRMYLPDMFPDHADYFCNGNASFTIDGITYDAAVSGGNACAIVVINSGGMYSVVVPDEKGFVEFMVEKTELSFDATMYYAHLVETGFDAMPYYFKGYYFEDVWNFGGEMAEVAMTGARLPDTGINMANVPADTYTLTFDNLPPGYAASKVQSVTVKDTQEIQYLTLVLEDVPLLGDVNSDKQINAADAALLLKAASLAGSGAASGLNADQEQSADVNGDGVYNASDAALILQYAAYAGSGGILTLEAYLAERTAS